MAFLSVPMCFREQHHTDFWNAFILVAALPRCVSSVLIGS